MWNSKAFLLLLLWFCNSAYAGLTVMVYQNNTDHGAVFLYDNKLPPGSFNWAKDKWNFVPEDVKKKMETYAIELERFYGSDLDSVHLMLSPTETEAPRIFGRRGYQEESVRITLDLIGRELLELNMSKKEFFWTSPQIIIDQFTPVPKPARMFPACENCSNYHGEIYGGVKFVCGIHPSGPMKHSSCPDFKKSCEQNLTAD